MKNKKVKEVINDAEGLAKVPEYRMYVDEVGKVQLTQINVSLVLQGLFCLLR
jgi:hypothetical protein